VPIALFIEESEPVILFPNPSRQSHTKKPSAHPYHPPSFGAPKHRSHSLAKKRTAHEYYPPMPQFGRSMLHPHPFFTTYTICKLKFLAYELFIFLTITICFISITYRSKCHFYINSLLNFIGYFFSSYRRLFLNT